MSNPDGAQPDPIADVGGTDIDALLEQTSALADKAGKEVGEPVEASGPDAPAPGKTSPAEGVPAADEKSEAEEASSHVEASESLDADDVDAKLADLEALLDKVAGDSRKPAAHRGSMDTDGGQPADAAQADPADANDASAADSSEPEAAPKSANAADAGLEDYDDFDIAVDLSDGDDQPDEQESEEKPTDAPEPEAPDKDDVPRTPIAASVLAAGVNAVAWVFVTLDRPFANISDPAKQVIGYVALATIVVAVGGLVYGSLVH